MRTEDAIYREAILAKMRERRERVANPPGEFKQFLTALAYACIQAGIASRPKPRGSRRGNLTPEQLADSLASRVLEQPLKHLTSPMWFLDALELDVDKRNALRYIGYQFTDALGLKPNQEESDKIALSLGSLITKIFLSDQPLGLHELEKVVQELDQITGNKIIGSDFFLRFRVLLEE